jgi:starch phosphorylase
MNLPKKWSADWEVLRRQYECGPVTFSGESDSLFERHLLFDYTTDPARAEPRQQFEALAWSVRDVLSQRWVKSKRVHDEANGKHVYYLSMEFLIGRSLVNNVMNLRLGRLARETIEGKQVDWRRLVELEPDAGLGNGGLGRLAACFIDSLATLEYPATGYGLRYDYGIFRQEIRNGAQVEYPDYWLGRPDPWEVPRPAQTVRVRFNATIGMRGGEIVSTSGQPTDLLGIPHDRPVVGFGGRTINTLRLWRAGSPDYFDFSEFSHGDLFGAVFDTIAAESLTRVLYPDDSTVTGRSLRFLQEYFLVACSLADIVARFRRRGNDWPALPDKVAIQFNDTHPAIAVAELMRILLDDAKRPWDEAWDLTLRTLAYTNHTLLPEALETWPVELFERVLPRHLDIIYEINRRFLQDVAARYPNDAGRIARLSLIEETPRRSVRMAHLAVVGSHSTNGVAQLHSDLLRSRVMRELAEMFPERFNNKTNGVTPRRWLRLCNPRLSRLIRDAIGEEWITDLSQLRRLRPLADDAAFRHGFRRAKRDSKVFFAEWLKSTTGQVLDPDTIFDSQVKRIHEYKRQLLNVLHIVVLYNRLRQNPALDVPPRTYLFAGKAAPAYALAKTIIRLICAVAAVLERDPAVRGRLRVVFVPNYGVTVAEHLIPASDVSEQISTAGFEASGTGNMKFMMNGALTIGTRDGATVEMAEEAGEENLFLFGLTAEQVLGSRGWYSPWWHYENEPETRAALDLIRSGHFANGDQSVFMPIWDALLSSGDPYMHLADLRSYSETQARLGALYLQSEAWARMSILNVASSGKFSSDRTIAEYARDIWGAVPCPVP